MTKTQSEASCIKFGAKLGFTPVEVHGEWYRMARRTESEGRKYSAPKHRDWTWATVERRTKTELKTRRAYEVASYAMATKREAKRAEIRDGV